MKIKIMTYNIQHCKNHNLPGDVIDYENTAAPIIDYDPDVVGLNEVRRGNSEPYADQPAMLERITGMKSYFKPSIFIKSANNAEYGNAILTNCRVASVEKIDIPDPEEKIYDKHYEHRSIIKAELFFEEKPLTVLVSHFGLNPDELSYAVDTVVECIRKIETPIILMGDFNDSQNNEKIRKLCKYLENTASALSNIENTFPSHSPEICIDQIWYRGVTPLEVSTVKRICSDHLPLTATFEI